MKSRLAIVLAGATIICGSCVLSGCGSKCSEGERRACRKVENGEPAAVVFGIVNPTEIRRKLERCVVCADGPGVRKALKAAKSIEDVLRESRSRHK